MVKGKRQAWPVRFDVGLLSGPTSKEAVISLGRRKCGKLTPLLLGEKAPGHRLVIESVAELFHVDTEGASTRKGEDSEGSRVRQC